MLYPRPKGRGPIDAVRLDLGWADVVSVVGTAIRHHAERDEKKQARWKNSFVGRDTRGRRLYLAELLDEGERIWFVIGVHEADPE